MEDFQFEIINIFNKNFKCKDIKKILALYKKDTSLIECFKGINLKVEKYHHPLIKNYNYCLLCDQKRKTKYNSNNLINTHIDLEDNTFGQFLLNNNIKIREIKNKKEKLVKRRFIHSYKDLNLKDKYKNKNKINYIQNQNNESDTELYISNNNYIKELTKNNKEKKINNLTNKNKITKIYLIKEEKDKDNIINIIKNNKYNNFHNLMSPSGQPNDILISKSSERKINLNDSNDFEKPMKLDGFKNKYSQEDKKTDIKDDDESIDKNNFIIDVKQNNKFSNKKSKSTINTNKSKYNNNLIESSDINTDTKINKDKEKENNNSNINIPKEEEDKVSVKSNKLLEIFHNTKNFFGFGKRHSIQNNSIKMGRLSKKFYDFYDNRKLIRSPTLKENKLKQKNTNNYIEKNDNCSICLQEIREKFTLTCGDFFCRDCLRTTILTAIKEIINLDKLHCPTCNENIDENTIKKLLTEEEFQHYQILITRINGLKNKEYIPCPYPDCPGWANENQNNNNIVYCQYEHTFCKKCLENLDIYFRQNSNEHKCHEFISEEEFQTKEFFKKNENYKKCPNCQSMVMRDSGGCNNMTCTNVWCGYEFCWICNKKYDESHYKNPLSMCFGLSEMNYEGRLAKYSRDRFFRCIFIFILIIFVILPVIIVFFSIFEVVLYIISFVLDGSAMKNIKLKSLFTHKLFYKIVYLFFISIGIAYIPLGYMSLVILAIASPIVCIIKRIRMRNDEELD